MEKLLDKQSAIKIVNCQIKDVQCISTNAHQFEVVSSTVQIEALSKRYKISTEVYEDNVTKNVKLENIRDLSVNQRITLNIKVFSVKDAQQITSKDGKTYIK
jgi:hypothetical protein